MIIKVNNLGKEFKVYERRQGFLSTLRNLIDYDYKIVKAVDGINFEIEKGEMVGFIGPNGAGKSTTVKILCGILVPTFGEVWINGLNPSKNRKKVARNMGVVFGQKTQLIWDLPVIESFSLLKDVYDMPTEKYRKNLDMLSGLLNIDEFINRPVRQLSLGQRMRADICASLLHEPEIIYFDEPTIGLDVVAKENIRDFVRTINKETGSTLLFTTHDMDDIEKTCRRLIIIDRGKIIYDGSLTNLKKAFTPEKMITVQFDRPVGNIQMSDVKVADGPENKKIFTLGDDPQKIRQVVNYIFENYGVKDILISEVAIEDLIRKIYQGNINLTEAAVNQ
jgi:ABC-2 type transport system ATP-binding protein